MSRISGRLFLGIVLSGCSCALAGDSFEMLKREFADAMCSRFEFMSVTESNIFQTVDSIGGSAVLAKDGRYRVNLGGDLYLYDGRLLHSYSADNQQVVVEKIDESDAFTGAEVSFIIRLDEYYRTTVIESGSEYALFRTDSSRSDIPDTLRITLKHETGRLDRLVYFDENSDRQQILITSQKLYDSCSEKFFISDWPEGTEIVKLY